MDGHPQAPEMSSHGVRFVSAPQMEDLSLKWWGLSGTSPENRPSNSEFQSRWRDRNGGKI